MSTDEEKISRLYHADSNEAPSSQLDDAILSAARDAVHKPAADKNIKAKSPFSGSWPATVSIAAVLIITVILVPLIEQDTPLPTSAEPAEENLLSTQEQEVQLEQDLEQKREQDTISQLRADAERKQINLKAKKRSLMKTQEVRSYQSAPVILPQGKLAEEAPTLKAMPESPMPSTSATSMSTPLPASRSMASPSLNFDRVENENNLLQLEDNLTTNLDEVNEENTTPPAKQWLEKIKKLIEQEDYIQARVELDAFKKQYPNEIIEPSIIENIDSNNQH